jgi:hypothetical protein
MIRFVFVKIIRLAQAYDWTDDNIAVLATWQDARALNIYTDQLGFRFPVYRIEQLDIPAEKTNAPYCFTLDSTLRISHLFFPDKYEGEISNTYLDLTPNPKKSGNRKSK